MSRTVSRCSRPFCPPYVALLLFTSILITTMLQRVCASPLPDFTYGNSTESSMERSSESSSISTESTTDNSTEITNTDVYVIKAVVYEIGILADTDNTTSSESAEGQESVDISLYNTPQEDKF